MPTDLEEERRKAKAENVRAVQAEIERQQELCKVMNIAALLDVQMEAAVASLQQETYSWRLPPVQVDKENHIVTKKDQSRFTLKIA